MTRPLDKAKEHAQASLVLSELKLGEIRDHRESPDFGIALPDGRTAGLEVVRAIDKGIAAGNGAIEKINKRVQAGLVAAGVNASVVVSITDGAAAVLATKVMKPQLAAEIDALIRLAKEALGVAPSPNSRIERRRAARGLPAPNSPWRRYERFSPDLMLDDTVCWRDPRRADGSYDLDGRGIEFATAVMVRPDDAPNVGRSGSSWGQPPSIIQEAIDAKASLLPKYKKAGYDEQWLLVIGSDDTGGTLDITDAEGEFVSPFDRTFFLESFAKECIELRTRTPDEPAK